MPRAARVIVLSIFGLLSTAALGALTALLSAVALAATALIVPGTGTPNANIVDKYLENARSRYLAPFSDCTTAADCNLVGIDYPASFYPLSIIPGWCVPGRCETWNVSVGEGVDNLYNHIDPTAADGEYVVFGYSQGGAVVSDALRRIAKDNPDLFAKISHVVTIGNVYNPDGGLFTRLGFLPTIPFLNVTFGPATPTDTGVPMTTIGFQYDPIVYAPLYWGNLLAVANAFAGFDNVHPGYLTPNGNRDEPMSYGYTDEELAAIFATGCPGTYCRVDGNGNEYWMLPAKSLPLMNLIYSFTPDLLKPIVKPLINLSSPVLKVLIDLAYDWSGDPGKVRYLSLLPFDPSTNWLKVGIDLAVAVVQGITDMINGGPTIAIPAGENSDANLLLAQRSVAPEPKQTVVPEGEGEDTGAVTGLSQKTGSDEHLGTGPSESDVEGVGDGTEVEGEDPVVTDVTDEQDDLALDEDDLTEEAAEDDDTTTGGDPTDGTQPETPDVTDSDENGAGATQDADAENDTEKKAA